MPELEDVRGIGEKLAERLRQEKWTVDRLSSCRPEDIMATIKCSRKAAKDLINSAKDIMFEEMELVTAAQEEKWREKNIFRLSSGLPVLDDILGVRKRGGDVKPGIPSMSSIGLAGEQATGKTQFFMQLVYNLITKTDQKAVWIETETNTWQASRLVEMAEARNELDILDTNKVLLVSSRMIQSPFAQFRAYELVKRKAEEKKIDIGLIVIDSFTAKFRRFYSGREMLPNRSGEMGRHLDFLEELSKRFNCIIGLTWQVLENPVEGGALAAKMRYGSNFIPWGGHVMRHTVNNCISVLKVKKDTYKGYVWDTISRPPGEFYFQVVPYGITEAEKPVVVKKKKRGTKV